jgi:CheY-like chemotaxis protein
LVTTKLLAVDDSKTMRKVFEITLAGEKYDSTIVGSPDEALGAVRSSTPQVAVVDGHLGASSGYDLCRQIKETAPQVKVLLLSSKQRPYDEAAGSAAGVDDHFDKPFDSSKFLAKLSELAESAGAPAPALAAPPRVAPAPAPPIAAAPVAAAPAPAPAAAPVQVSAPAAVPRPAAVPSAAPQRPQAPPPRVETAKPAIVSPAKPVPAAPVQPMVAAASAVANGMEGKLQALGLTQDQVKGVLALSRDVVEQVVWEVVPQLAETLIKEEIARLTAE